MSIQHPSFVAPRHLSFAVAVATVALVGCSSSSDDGAGPSTTKPTSTTIETSSGADEPEAETSTTSTAADGNCPSETEITVHTDAGDKTFIAEGAKATVTLDTSLEFAIGSYAVPDDAVGSFSAPTLTDGQLLVTGYLSVAQGTEALEPGTYVSVVDELGPLQLNTTYAYDAAGQIYFTGIPTVSDTVELTEVDKEGMRVCGTITTQLFDGTFAADVISWS